MIIGSPHTTEITQKHDVHIDYILPNTMYMYIKKLLSDGIYSYICVSHNTCRINVAWFVPPWRLKWRYMYSSIHNGW